MLNPTPIDRLVWPEERISQFGLRNSECGAMRLLPLQIIFQKDPSFEFKSSPCIYYLITLGFVKLTRVSNATIEAAIAGMYRQKSENVCGNSQALLIRTRFIKWKQRNWTFFVFLTDVARDPVSSIVTALLTPSLILLLASLFGTNGKRELVKKCGPLV